VRTTSHAFFKIKHKQISHPFLFIEEKEEEEEKQTKNTS